MPDFFDRLIARSAGPDGMTGGAAATASDPERRAALVVARPRVPGPFERPAPHILEQEWEAEAPPPPLGPDFVPPLSVAAPASLPQGRTRAELVRAPVAYRGAERDRELLLPAAAPVAPPLPAAPYLAVPPAGVPAISPAGPDTAIGILIPPDHQLGGGPDAPIPAPPGGTPAPGPGPQIPAVPARRRPTAAHVDGETIGWQVPPPPEPAVRIRIGRIEVRASDPAGRHGSARRAPARAAPVLSLDRFLAGEGGRR